MSRNVVALVPTAPDRRALIHALAAADRDLRVRMVADGALVELLDEEGRVVASMQAAQRLTLATEADRLLASEIADDLPAQPYWVEARGTHLPGVDPTGVVSRFARSLTDRLGGVVWTPEPALSSPAPFLTGSSERPAIAAVTERAAVMVEDRPLVPLSPWVVDAMSHHSREETGFQLLTPHTARLTHALARTLRSPAARWVVQAPGNRYYDGFSGLPLRWDEREAFVVDREAAEEGPLEEYRPDRADHASQLLVDLTVEHPAENGLVLGEAVELIGEILAGAGPAVWGTAEPLTQEWRRTVFTRTVRMRAPRPTLAVFSGLRGEGVRPFEGTVRVSRTASGVREAVSCVIGFPEGEEHDPSALPALVKALTERELLRTLTVHRLHGRSDLTYAPHWVGPPIPVGIALGVEAVSEVGTEHAVKAPIRPVPFGSPMAPALWYSVGTGIEEESWPRFRALMTHLTPDSVSSPGSSSENAPAPGD